MRLPRLTLDDEACSYHCIARTIDQKWFFDTPARRDRVQEIIRAVALLRGATLLNHVVMSNHIHALIEIQSPSSRIPLTKETLIAQAKVLYSQSYVTNLKNQFARAEKRDSLVGDNWHSQQILDLYEARRGCLSGFMKEVKERIAFHINKDHRRRGALWDGRFKSPIVQKTLAATLEVSTYIDLNPIRAGIVTRPEDYRWCGYGAALGGNQMAREGLVKIYSFEGPDGSAADQQAASANPKWSEVAANYRQYLFERGLEVLEDPESGIKARLGFTAEQVEQEIQRKGQLPKNEVLLYRVRYFTDGAVIGSAKFVDQIFNQHRANLVARNSLRSTGARKMRGAKWGNLTTLRDLRINVIGHPVW